MATLIKPMTADLMRLYSGLQIDMQETKAMATLLATILACMSYPPLALGAVGSAGQGIVPTGSTRAQKPQPGRA